MRSLPLAATAACALAIALGCGSLRLPFRGGVGRSGIESFTKDDLREELAGYANRFSAVVTGAAEDIAAATQQRSVRKRTLLWQMRMIPAVQTAAFADSPQEGYVRCLGLSLVQRLYLTSGEGRDLFGPQQSIAADAARQLEQDAVDLGARFLPPEKLAKVRADVEALAERYPIAGRDFSLRRVQPAAVKLQATESVISVLTFPLAPFRALEGVDSGAAAIRDFNATARQFSEIVSQLPAQLRAEAELLLYDVEDRETVVRSVDAIEAMAASAQRASDSIDRLPVDVRKTLADSQGALREANQALGTARDLLVPLAGAAEQVKLAGAAWAALVPEQTEGEPKGRPFDIREWQAAADSIGRASGELRELAAALDRAQAAQQISAAVDRAAWRGVELLALFFGTLVAYRLLSWRLARAAGPAASR